MQYRRKKVKSSALSKDISLFTDLYELRMMQSYLEEGLVGEAVFSLSVRRMPPKRNLLLACGLQTVLDYLEGLRFDKGDLAYLKRLGGFSSRFLDWLGHFRFEGAIRAMPEGTPFFPNEPILEVVAPLPQAQLIETFVMNQVHLQTLLASKAYRVVAASAGKTVVDFGSRRTHGIDAAIKAARAFYIGGISATSNVLAGKMWGVPVAGTMAHSYIQAHEDEREAFERFALLYPETTLLVDTYDSIVAVEKIIRLIRDSGGAVKVKAIRLDSGDLLSLSKEARRLLDDAGLFQVEIFASGGLDEYEIHNLIESGAPINGFGVGTSMVVSRDAPDLDIAYKLCEYDGKGRMQLSNGKQVLPGRKQVFRRTEGGFYCCDVIGLENERLAGIPLLVEVMREGARIEANCPSLNESRRYAAEQIAKMPAPLRGIQDREIHYPVEVSEALAEYQRMVEAELTR